MSRKIAFQINCISGLDGAQFPINIRVERVGGLSVELKLYRKLRNLLEAGNYYDSVLDMSTGETLSQDDLTDLLHRGDKGLLDEEDYLDED